MFKFLWEAGVLGMAFVTAYLALLMICALSDRCSAGW